VACPADNKSVGRNERLSTTVAAIVHPELEVTEASDFCGSSGEKNLRSYHIVQSSHGAYNTSYSSNGGVLCIKIEKLRFDEVPRDCSRASGGVI
jgi:hypothetical protein